MRLMVLGVLLAGCHLSSSEVEVTCEDWPGGCDDMDRDGYVGDEDCDPENGAINPAATDVIGDDIDQNCDGEDGIAGQGTVTDEDQDDDGYRSDEECDDGNGAINPEATDVAGDGIDQNCDGIDGVDGDGDGQAAWWSSGGDCDDGDAAIYAGAADPGGDGVDSDCDGDDGTPPGPGVFYGDLTLGSVEDVGWFCGSYDRIVGTLTLAEGVADVSGLSCLAEVSGSLRFMSPQVLAISLPQLVRVGGNLEVTGGLEAIDLPALVEVGGTLTLSTVAGAVGLPALERAGGVAIYGSGATDIALPALTDVTGSLILRNDADSTLDLSALVTVGSLQVTDYGAASVDLRLASLEEAGSVDLSMPVSTLTLNRLSAAGSIYVYSTLSGGQLNLPALTSLNYISISYAGVAAPVLTETDHISLNYGVDVASFAALDTVGTLDISSTELTHLNGFSALRTVTGEVYLYGNYSLVSVAGLEGLESFNYFTFYYNFPITDAELLDLIALLGATSYYIYGNG